MGSSAHQAGTSTAHSSATTDFGESFMIELTPQQQEFVDAQVATGIFKEPAEVVGVALSLLQQRQREYEQLETAIGQIERGEYGPLDIDDIKRRAAERRLDRIAGDLETLRRADEAAYERLKARLRELVRD